ncbi:unnamed protein product [Closterium sp. NIES-53]
MLYPILSTPLQPTKTIAYKFDKVVVAGVVGVVGMVGVARVVAALGVAEVAPVVVVAKIVGGRSLQFDTWLDDQQLYLLSDSKDSASLFDLASGHATAPPATADSATRSHWLTRDAAGRLAIRNHLLLNECAHIGQHRTAQAQYAAVLARYSSPTTAALGRLLLPYLFPELSAFATVEDLVSHLRTSDARYRATVPAELLNRNQPPMFITLYFIVTRLPNSLRSIRDHFLSLDPTSLTVDLLEQHLLAAETSAVAVGAARGTPRPPFFEGDVGAASASAKHRTSKGKGGKGGGGGSGGGGGGSGSGGGGSSGGGGGGGTSGGSGGSGGGGGGSSESGGSGGGWTGGSGTGARRVGYGGGQRQQPQRQIENKSPQQLGEWFLRGASGGSCPYVIRTGVRAGQTCGKLHTQHCWFSRLDDAWRAEFGDDIELPHWADLLTSRIAIFDLDFDAIFSAMYALSVSSEGDSYRCVPLDPGIAAAALGASESGTLPGTAPAQALHTFTLDSGSSRCFFRDSTTLTPLPTPVPVKLADPYGGPVLARSSTVLPCLAVPSGSLPGLHVVSASSQVVASCSCRLLSHQTLLWHHRLGHPSLPRLCGMHSCLLVSSLPRSMPPLPPSPAPPCLPCVEVQQRVAPHSSSFPPMTAPVQTLHMDVWGPARDLPVLRLHSDRGGEFSSNLLREFCRGEGILQSFTLPYSPLQNGFAECRIGLVMEFARTSMTHAAGPHFLLPFAVQYAAHQLSLWPHVSLPETSPTLRWTGEVGDASVVRVWGSRAFVRDTSADKLSAHAISCDVTFDKSVPFYRLFPFHSAPPPPPPLLLAPDLLPGTAPVEEAVGSGAALGAASRGSGSEGAGFSGAEPGGEEPWGAETEGVASGGAEPRGAASSGGPAGASPRLSPQQLCEWLVRCARLRSGAPGAGDAGAGGAGVTVGARGAGGIASAGPGFARTRDAGAAGTGGVGGAGAGDPTEHGGSYAGGAGAGGAGAGGAGVGVCREPTSRPVSPVRTARRAPRLRPPPVPGTYAMALCPSSVPLRVPLPAPPKSSLLEVPDPESDCARATSPTASCLLAIAVSDPSFEFATASALVAELLDFATACRLDYATALVAESVSACPPSVGGECALGTVVPRCTSMLLAPEGDPDAPDILTPRSYAGAITGPYSSQWQAAMDAEMESWKSTGTYVNEVPPPGVNIVDGMWIFRVKRPPGSPLVFKARYIAQGFSQRQGVDYFQTFSPTLKMTTRWVLQHVAT